jgi:hypothetical protein
LKDRLLNNHSLTDFQKIEMQIKMGELGPQQKPVRATDPPGALIKKENQIFLIYKEIQSGAVAKSYTGMTNGLLIYGEIFAHFPIYEEAIPHI